MKNGEGVISVSVNNSFSDLHNPSFHTKTMQQYFLPISMQRKAYVIACSFLASNAGVFSGAPFSSLPTNTCSTENNIPFPLFYLRGK